MSYPSGEGRNPHNGVAAFFMGVAKTNQVNQVTKK